MSGEQHRSVPVDGLVRLRIKAAQSVHVDDIQEMQLLVKLILAVLPPCCRQGALVLV